MNPMNILAVVPKYETGTGNVCVLYNFDGTTTIQTYTVKTQMKQLFKQLHLDQKETTKRTQSVLGIKKNIPIAYAHDFIFVPLRVRLPMTKNDGAYAYIRLNAIHAISDYKIALATGEIVDCLQKKEGIQDAIRRAKIMESILTTEENHKRTAREYYSHVLKEGHNLFNA